MTEKAIPICFKINLIILTPPLKKYMRPVERRTLNATLNSATNFKPKQRRENTFNRVFP